MNKDNKINDNELEKVTGGTGDIKDSAPSGIILPEGKTLDVSGENGSGTTGGGAGILIPGSNSLKIN